MPLKAMTIGLLMTGWFVLGIASLVLMIKAKPYRTDVTDKESFTSGQSWAWEPNALNPNNYTGEGRRKLAAIYACLVAQVVLLVTAGVLTVSP